MTSINFRCTPHSVLNTLAGRFLALRVGYQQEHCCHFWSIQSWESTMTSSVLFLWWRWILHNCKSILWKCLNPFCKLVSMQVRFSLLSGLCAHINFINIGAIISHLAFEKNVLRVIFFESWDCREILCIFLYLYFAIFKAVLIFLQVLI